MLDEESMKRREIKQMKMLTDFMEENIKKLERIKASLKPKIDHKLLNMVIHNN